MNNELILNKIREHYGLKRNIDFAKYFGISEQNANAWYKRTSLDYEAIYKYCPEINPDWLLSGGEGEMLRTATQSINGNNNTQVGGNYAPENEGSGALRTALDALREEQGIAKKAQEQADSLIEIIKQMTGNGSK